MEKQAAITAIFMQVCFLLDDRFIGTILSVRLESTENTIPARRKAGGNLKQDQLVYLLGITCRDFRDWSSRS